MYVRCTITVTILSLCAHDTTQFVADTIAYFILYAVHLNALNMYVQVVYGSDYYECIPTTEERRKKFAQFKRNYRETRKSIVIRNVQRRSAEFRVSDAISSIVLKAYGPIAFRYITRTTDTTNDKILKISIIKLLRLRRCGVRRTRNVRK